MKCKRCPEGRRFASGCTFCRWYGMILPDEHECRQERGKEHERNGNYRLEGYDGPKVRDNGGWFAGGRPDVLSEPGEREGLPGVDEAEEGGKE